MGVYNKNGFSLNSVYLDDGSVLPAAYATDGTLLTWDGSFLATAIVTPLTGNMYITGNRQGACTDGTNIYQFCFSSPRGVTYNISAGTHSTVALNSSVEFGHGNDMAYNPNNQHIYVAAMTNDGAVQELDTSWNYITTHYLVNDAGNPYPVWGLCFDQKTNHFLSEIGNTKMAVYDQNFNYLSYFDMPSIPSATAQGCETDGAYIYRVWYKPNTIDVSTMTGEYVTSIINPMEGEPESLIYDWENDRYFINRNTTRELFYRIQLK